MEDQIKQQDQEVQEGKIFAVMAYLGILCLLPLLLKKENKFALFHGKQGLVIFIGEIAAMILSIIPFLGWMISFLAFLFFGIISLVGIVQALMGNFFKMPVISNFAEKISL